MFAVFLALSILFWFLSKLSKEYTNTIKFRPNYINTDNDKILQKEPLNQIDLTLKTFGFNFLSYKLNKPKLDIDLSNLQKLKNGKYFCLTNRQLSSLQSQISGEVSIVAISPDTIFFDFGLLKVKKVKVKPNLKLNFKKGFYLTSEIVTEPEFITITGPKKKIDSIKEVITDEIIFDAVFKNFNKKIPLKMVNNVKYSDEKVKIIGEIEKFTEGKLSLNFDVININDSIKINTFVKKINITYKVSLNNFDKVFEKDFKIICDFLKTKKQGLNYLLPEVVKTSPFVSDLKINPTKIEYLIKK